MIVDVKFLILARGGHIPADHGYPLYSAVSRVLAQIHQTSEIGILPINGTQTGDRGLFLTPESRLVIRIDAGQISTVLPLAGKTLGIGKTTLQIGVPSVHALIYASTLRSRLVTIKGFMEAEQFSEAVRRQLDILEISQEVTVHIRKRRTLRIRDREVVGYEVFVDGLSDTESLRLQEVGIGGRRKMGCGLFLPWTMTTPTPTTTRKEKSDG
ncbi:MAG: type I-MYXAN CRISPR-associated protein Cas6/Cmx6 [Thermoguttaceae bacterium]